MNPEKRPFADMASVALAIPVFVGICWTLIPVRSAWAAMAYGIVHLMIAGLVLAVVLSLIVLFTRRAGKWVALLAILSSAVAIWAPINLIECATYRSPQIQCISNVHSVGLTLRMYVADHNGTLPPAIAWPEALVPVYLTEGNTLLYCPADERSQWLFGGRVETSYSMNELCGGTALGDFAEPEDTLLLFDGTGVAGRRGVAAFRHGEGLNVGYVDGHAQHLTKEQFRQVRMKPTLETSQ